MAVVIDEVVIDPGMDREAQQRSSGGSNGGDSGSGSGGEPPKPEELERAWKQQVERAERIWAH